MKTPVRRFGPLPLAVIATLAGASGCGRVGSGEAPQPIAVHETTPLSLPRIPVGPNALDGPPVTSTQSPLATVDACSLVPPGVVARLGGSGKGQDRKNYGIFTSDCEWQVPGKYTFGVAVTTVSGIDGVTSDGPKTSVSVGNGQHRAVRSRSGVNTCAISIAVTKTSRVDTQSTPSGDNVQACRVAETLADAVEPKLPPQQGNDGEAK